jgi:DNA-directed RNA polymerase subunit RPC12/RpoP
MPSTLDMFSVDGKKPRRPPRVMMHVVDAGQSEGGPIICFGCTKCGHNTDWIEDDQSVSQNKKGRPCPECNSHL